MALVEVPNDDATRLGILKHERRIFYKIARLEYFEGRERRAPYWCNAMILDKMSRQIHEIEKRMR